MFPIPISYSALKLILVLSTVLNWMEPCSGHASVEIDITAEQVTPLPIAVSPFHGSNKNMAELGDNLARVLRNNLEYSGIFTPIAPQAYLQSPESVNNFPRFPDWRSVGARLLVHGRVLAGESEIASVEYRLWDLSAEEQILGLRYRFRPELWRRVAHIIADRIFTALTGEEGFFDSRIVYVAESGPPMSRVKRLAIIDTDGGNHRFLTQGKALVLTPRFSPADQTIAYMSYYSDLPRVYLFNLDTGEQRILGDFPGMTFAPRFSPDGQKVVLSMAHDGNSDIFVLDIHSNRVKRLTRNPAIDTSPDYAPDGHQITFNSDRGGSQQLYVMSSDGRDIRRISFGEGRYATPVWSPRGDLIAFTRINRGSFSIGVMRPDGSHERVLTKGFLVESPSWSPNGRYLVFFRQTPANRAGRGGTNRLYMIDVSGRYEREIATPVNASDPAWSPLRR